MSIHSDPRRYSTDEEEVRAWENDMRMEYAKQEYDEMTREKMTREEAITELKNIQDNFNYSLCPNEVFEMAIEALKTEPCEDAVKREAVLNTLDTMDKVLDEDRTVEHYKELLKECYKELPPVTPARNKGMWILHRRIINGHLVEHLECDQCLTFFLREHLVRNSFCPNCGSEMEWCGN